jgi:dienelactone hydrolase
MMVQELEIDIPVDYRRITATLGVPDHARSLVVFAHGSGSGRLSSQNRFLAEELRSARIATLRLGLLTPDEEEVDARSGLLRFDVDLLADRVDAVTDWVATSELLRTMRIGYFGASTGAAAALMAAARRPSSISAIVSRGGRPDLAGVALAHVSAPTLLIVGGEDHEVLAPNEEALNHLWVAHKQLRLIPGATHLFEEAGALEQVAALAREWFETFLEGHAAVGAGAAAP